MEALVSGEQLSALTAEEVTVVELTSSYPQYLRAHLPGSLWADLHQTFALRRGPDVHYGVPSPEEFAEVMSGLGIRPGHRVVFADDGGNRWATRAYWVCRLYRHRPVHVLDGGISLWMSEGRLTEEGSPPQPEMTDYPPPAGIDRSILATREDVVEALGSHAELLCDVRTRDEYEGRGEPGRMARRMGHIPQSRWLPWESALAAGGSFLSPDELRAALAPLLADERPKITYCQGGIRASNTWFALSEILGVPARMYAASWEEWGNRDDTPIER